MLPAHHFRGRVQDAPSHGHAPTPRRLVVPHLRRHASARLEELFHQDSSKDSGDVCAAAQLLTAWSLATETGETALADAAQSYALEVRKSCAAGVARPERRCAPGSPRARPRVRLEFLIPPSDEKREEKRRGRAKRDRRPSRVQNFSALAKQPAFAAEASLAQMQVGVPRTPRARARAPRRHTRARV
jgi:hypothetical protein